MKYPSLNGGWYNTLEEAVAADTEYRQREKQNKLLEEQNRLLKKQQERKQEAEKEIRRQKAQEAADTKRKDMLELILFTGTYRDKYTKEEWENTPGLKPLYDENEKYIQGSVSDNIMDEIYLMINKYTNPELYEEPESPAAKNLRESKEMYEKIYENLENNSSKEEQKDIKNLIKKIFIYMMIVLWSIVLLIAIFSL